MKRFLRGLLLLSAAVMSLPASAAALKVFACESEWGALARELGGDRLDIYVATHALQDVHRIQPKPSLIARYRQADVLICTGAELEAAWLTPLASIGNNPRLRPGAPGYVEASAFVTMRERPLRLDRAEGDVHPGGNPHIQTGPQNILPVAQGLAARLAVLDPTHADDYAARLAQFTTRWNAALARWQEKARPLQGLSVISAHRSWVYLYEWLGLKEVATIEPRPGLPPSAAHLESLLDRLKTQPATMVIYAAYQDRRPVEWLSARASIPAVELPFSPGGAPGTEDLFGLFEVTLERLLAASAASAPK